jgi:hypothetical protein
MSGSEVPDAVIDPADIERFAATFQSGDHFEAYAIARDKLLINGLIPEASRMSLRSVVGEPASSGEGVRLLHSIRLGKGPGSADVKLTIDWRAGIWPPWPDPGDDDVIVRDVLLLHPTFVPLCLCGSIQFESDPVRSCSPQRHRGTEAKPSSRQLSGADRGRRTLRFGPCHPLCSIRPLCLCAFVVQIS